LLFHPRLSRPARGLFKWYSARHAYSYAHSVGSLAYRIAVRVMSTASITTATNSVRGTNDRQARPFEPALACFCSKVPTGIYPQRQVQILYNFKFRQDYPNGIKVL
jgi:hypothetical protein